MAKAVIVIASGETERRALPHLLAHLRADGIVIMEVRIPPGGRTLNLDMAERLLKAAWFERLDTPPEKFVILLDTDGNPPDEIIRPFREQLPTRIQGTVHAQLQCAYAQRHLEAWYFADDSGLRAYLERDTGNIDTSNPDGIQNPKLHLKHLLGERAYTAIVSEEIARTLDPKTIAQRSASFEGFLRAVRNGKAAEVERN